MKLRRFMWLPLLVLLVSMLATLLFLGQLEKLQRYVDYYLGEPTPAQQQVMAYARENGHSYADYPESIIALLERNPETEEFVFGYPTREEASADLREFENSATMPLFLQWDRRWGYEIYGSDVIGITGCGPTCLAMAGYWLTGEDRFAPHTIAEFSARNGYYEPGAGSSWTLISEGGVLLGLDVTEIPLVKKRMMDNLEVGNPIICAMGPGDFTTEGHYIVLTGLEDGKIRVNDPNSRENSARLWTYEELESQIRNLWVIRFFG